MGTEHDRFDLAGIKARRDLAESCPSFARRHHRHTSSVIESVQEYDPVAIAGVHAGGPDSAKVRRGRVALNQVVNQ